ncbi:hypothetical protein AB0362_25185 [Rhodococcus sp. NPDC079359]|jgi:hypothetical protein|uniref:hypothetical protein n=1 Tax=Nocardiaceae TaxID=85025 RepID=UPI000AEE2858|nr:hypothetical protein [Rhodococcus fascians]
MSVNSELHHDIDFVTTTEGYPEDEEPHHEIVVAFVVGAVMTASRTGPMVEDNCRRMDF